MRPHTRDEAVAAVAAVAEWQPVFEHAVGRRLVYAADEYYLLAGWAFPPAEEYDGFVQHENGIGMARAFEADLLGDRPGSLVGGAGHTTGFFQWVEGAPAEGYRAPRAPTQAEPAKPAEPAPRDPANAVEPVRVSLRGRRDSRPPIVLTGEYGASVLAPLLTRVGREDVELVPVRNEFFGGNIAVTGLITGSDVASVLSELPEGRRYLLPDVCLSNGLFLDGVKVSELPRPVEIVATDGRSLLEALGSR
jgi:NifB/MoaA-like Fe-S oxidoreductase